MKPVPLLLLSLLFAPAAQAISSLHDALPADTVAYMRLSGNESFIGAADGTPLHGALTQPALAERETGLLPGLAGAMAAEPALAAAAPWLDLVARLRAPIEAIGLLPPGRPASMANVLLRARVEVDSASAVDQLIGLWAEANPQLDLVSPLQQDPVGILTWGAQVPVLYAFDANAKALYLMTGLAADVPSFQHALASLQPITDHPMYAVEQRLDSTGQGPFLWLDGGRVMSGLAVGPGMPGAGAGPGAGPGMPGMMPGMGADAVGAVAVGWGSRDGKGRLGVLVEVPESAGLGAMLPPIDNRFDIEARGEPWLVYTLSLPLRQLLQMGEGMLQMDPQAAAEYEQAQQGFLEATGMDFSELAGTFGLEWVFFGDTVGEYGAVRLVDPNGLERLLAVLNDVEGVDHDVRRVGGVDYHHLAIETPREEASEAMGDATANGTDADPVSDALERVAARAKTHLYWIEQDGFLVFAQVPQTLMDRVAASNPVPIGDWLRTEQGQDPRHALTLLSTRIDGVPRRTYYAVLQFMEQIGDITGQPLDLFALQPAHQLGLPDSGAYGFQLDIRPQWLSMEFTFESNPAEFLLGNNGAFVAAAIGVLVAAASEDGEDREDEEMIDCGAASGQQAYLR